MHLIMTLLIGLLYLISAIAVIWLLWAFVACINAYMNKRDLKRPTHVIGSLELMLRRDWHTVFWRGGIRVLVFDVDNALCPTYGTLPPWAIDLIKYLHEKGFEIWLASESNPNMEIIEGQIGEYAKVYWPANHGGIKKPSMEFFNFFMGLGHRVAFIGDKLTDMGLVRMNQRLMAYSVLVNPISKDLRGENSVMLRRVRERCTLRGWGIKRASDMRHIKVV